MITRDLVLQDNNTCLEGCHEFECVGVKLNKKVMKDDIKHKINKDNL